MNTLMWLCAAAALGIFGVMLHSVATFGSGEKAGPRRNAFVEVIWALIPILIVIAAALPSFQLNQPSPVAIAASD